MLLIPKGEGNVQYLIKTKESTLPVLNDIQTHDCSIRVDGHSIVYQMLVENIRVLCLLTFVVFSRTTKVFVNHQTTQQSGCLQCYAEVSHTHYPTQLAPPNTTGSTSYT